MTDAAPNRSRRGCGCGTLVLGCLGVILAGAALVTALLVFVWWQWSSAPPYWETQRARVQQLTPAERDQHARAVEDRFATWHSSALQADPDTNFAAAAADREPAAHNLSMTFDEINAWLDQRLESWAAQQDVDLELPVREVIVTSQDGKLVIAGDVHVQRFRQIVSAVIDAHLLPDGDLHLHVQRVQLGRIPVPSDALAAFAREQMPQEEQTEAVKRVLEIFEGTTFTPVFPRDGQHELRLTHWQVSDEGIELTVTPTVAETPTEPQ